MKKKYFLPVLCCALSSISFSQVTLKATGAADTYALINSVLAPESDVTEVPDCGHNVKHIDQVLDNDINDYAFRFHLHVDEVIDTDRCKSSTDRQRNEIKTFDKSPDNLLGVEGETVVYKWKFKLDEGFQPSADFTHLHQIKAVGGTEESTPNISLTARKGNPDKLELRYAQNVSQTTILKVDLDPFKGNWVNVVETITYGEEADGGAYEILITNLATGTALLSYKDDSIRMWKTGAEFIRPKWGIYRSLKSIESLRDETVSYTDFSIEEKSEGSLTVDENVLSVTKLFYQDPITKEIVFSDNIIESNESVSLYNLSGQEVFSADLVSNRISVEGLASGIYFVKLSSENNTSLKIVID